MCGAAAVIIAAAGMACAQGSGQRPAAAGRLVRVFDFEEQQTNPGEVPQFWFRNQDMASRSKPGFPNWNRGVLVYDEQLACDGHGCVRLPTQGGSSSLMLETGVLPIFADTDYRVFAHVRTDGLKFARAALIARFVDTQGNVIAGSERMSEPLQSDQTWRQVTVDLTSADSRAAFIQLELVLLQLPAALQHVICHLDRLPAVLPIVLPAEQQLARDLAVPAGTSGYVDPNELAARAVCHGLDQNMR